ncbi:hypothetical protein JG688_00008486 [Phytophthora aleatoria]|uniref:Uncharacterized protein n=1 Tax=Phytophthora aleatoria TaxID=2496075 RepID=A0A8J5J4Q9_9STRA|nr:hypothetical protein JG688_00008486 [Phytophthora aleatoria]
MEHYLLHQVCEHDGIYERPGPCRTAQQELALDQGKQKTTDTQTLCELCVGHGDMLDYDSDTVATAPRQSFRPGMKSLRGMKMYCTLGEFMRMDAHFAFNISLQKEPQVAKMHLDGASCNGFQGSLRQFTFQQSCGGCLCGTMDPDIKKVTADFIYEWPQEDSPYGWKWWKIRTQTSGDVVGEALGYEKDLQADVSGKGSLLLTLKVTLDKEGQASFEAFPVSDQCVEMFPTGVLMENEQNPKACAVNDTLTAFVGANAAREVDSNMSWGCCLCCRVNNKEQLNRVIMVLLRDTEVWSTLFS